jgi:FtsH-binding integral membrane protein
MAGTTGTERTGEAPSLQLTDGRPHPLLNLASACTLVVGLVSFALGMVLRYGTSTHALALAAAITGLASLLVGLYTQMVSATRVERILLVTGMIAGFVGLALGLAHGGFS